MRSDAPGSHDDWDEVLETGRAYVAALAALMLREAGIEAEVVDQSGPEAMPTVRSFSVVRVLVPTHRVAEARRLLADPVWLPEDAEPR